MKINNENPIQNKSSQKEMPVKYYRTSHSRSIPSNLKVFIRKNIVINACKIDKVTTDLGISTTDYANKIRELLKEYQQNSFDTLVNSIVVRKFHIPW